MANMTSKFYTTAKNKIRTSGKKFSECPPSIATHSGDYDQRKHYSKSLTKFLNIRLTTGALSGDLARTMGSAKEDTTNPIVINIANSYTAVLLEPEFSA